LFDVGFARAGAAQVPSELTQDASDAMTNSALRADFALADFALAALALADFVLAALARADLVLAALAAAAVALADFALCEFTRTDWAVEVALTAAVTRPTAAEVARALPAASAEVIVTSIRCPRSAATSR
jgi:hypothetical protein